MGLVWRQGYSEDIKQHNFNRIATLFRNGGISDLNQEELNLLADYLEGKLERGKGRPKNQMDDEIALCFFEDYESLRKYSITRSELAEKVASFDGNPKEFKQFFNSLQKQMARKAAIEALCSRNYLNEQKGYKDVEQWITRGKKLYEENIERAISDEFGGVTE